MVDDNGLRVAGTHTGIDTVLGEELERTVALNRTFGNPYLIVPGLPVEYTASAEAWRRTAALFNECAERAEALGARVGYHNHATEFKALEGEVPIEIFLDGTDTRVIMQFDNCNALHGGADVNPLIERYPGRAVTIHLKEYSKKDGFVVPCEGDVPWTECFRMCESVGGTEWYIVEFENQEYPAMESVAKALANIRAARSS